MKRKGCVRISWESLEEYLRTKYPIPEGAICTSVVADPSRETLQAYFTQIEDKESQLPEVGRSGQIPNIA